MAAPPQIRDPAGPTALIAAVFAALCLWRLTIPSIPMFDEVHYLPAARAMLDDSGWLNREHPMLGKEAIAVGIALFGDNSFGWRIFSAIAGVLALYAFMRALWFATGTRFAPLAGGVLLATAFPLFVQSRIAMLDIYMIAFVMVALWQCAAAVREPETGRWRLAIAGVALGLALGSKWNAAPVIVLPGLAFLALRYQAGRRRLLLSRRGAPVPGITLVEAAIWLGVVPLVVYALTFAPLMFLSPGGGHSPDGLIALHREMIALQENVTKPHPYQSNWPDWVLNIRAIWYLYEPVDGAQRGIILVGNPATMLLGLLALAWCAWVALARRRADALAVFVLYAVSLGLWLVLNKPIQFYYHYALPSCFLVAALALALDAMWQSGRRVLPLAVLALCVALFAYFYPVLSAAPLSGPNAFMAWTWLPSWR